MRTSAMVRAVVGRPGRGWRSIRFVSAAAIGTIVLLIPSVADARPCWQPPVSGPVSDPFRDPVCRWCPGNRGIEYSTQPGAIVRSVAAGTVSYAGTIAGTRYVVIRHATGWRATYGDLAHSRLRTGDTVVSRSIVGLASSRLHFGVRDGSRYLDPERFLGEWTYRVRLAPLDGSPPAGAGLPRLTCGR